MNTNTWVPIVSSIGGIILGSILTFMIVRWQQQHKEISYKIESIPIFTRTRKDVLPPDVQILYHGDEVWDLYSFKIAIRNTGNTVLTNLPIIVELGQNARILNLSTLIPEGVEIGNLTEDELTDSNKAQIKLDFFNRGDQIELGVIGAENLPVICKIRAPMPGLRCKERSQLLNTREYLRIALELFSQIRPFSFVPFIIPIPSKRGK